ncbi:M56 family metallopeptidase [Rubrivirga sp.]|uniref:M56 family metallopeptidase n=1 Tax=Rubrivirga sp. TaxID=1885344 RepID=UPI003C761E41
MTEILYTLAEIGELSSVTFWTPVLLWTVLVLAVEIVLEKTGPSAAVGSWVRGASLALLPALVALPSLLAPFIPSLVAAPALGEIVVLAGEGSVLEDGAAPILSWTNVLIGGLTLGAVGAALAALSVLAGGVFWLSRTRRTLRPATPEVQATTTALATRLGIERRVEAVHIEVGRAPFTIGWWRPVVAVPSDLEGDALELALLHELSHVRRDHFGWHLAEQVVGAVFVWHPLVHVLRRGLDLDRERVADADVIGTWPDRAERYGRLLTSFAHQSAPPLALGASSSILIHRLTAMTRVRPDRKHLARFLGAALFLVPLLLATAAVPDAQPPPPPPPPPPPAFQSHPLLEKVQEVSVWREGDDIERVRVRLNPGTSSQDAVRVADYLSRDGDAQTALVVIDADGREIERPTIRLELIPPPPPPPAPGPPPPPPAPAPPPAIPASLTADGIESVSVRQRTNDAPRYEVRMKPGESRSAAVSVTNAFVADGIAGTLVVITASGERIER